MKKYLVYFISVNDTFVKVGCTHSTLHQRFEALQIGCPYPIKAEGIIRCSSKEEMQKIESKFKQDFTDFHKHGEWYYLSQSVSEFISSSTENADKELEVSQQEFLERRRQRYKNTPEIADASRNRSRENSKRYYKDPEFRERRKKYRQDWYRKNKSKDAAE